MKEIKDIDELRRFLWRYDELGKIARSLHRQDENACNGELTQWQEARVKTLEKKAQSLVDDMGLVLYRQGDPRGCPLYLLDRIEDKDNYSTHGIAVC